MTGEIQCTQPESEQTGSQCSISVSLQDLTNPVATNDSSSSGDVCPSVSEVDGHSNTMCVCFSTLSMNCNITGWML